LHVDKNMILVVDDDRAIRSSLSLMLERNNYEVVCAAMPEEAIEVVRTRTPQLVLMDMSYSAQVDVEEGLTLLKQVKVFCPKVPVILMTAWGSIQLAVRGMQAGAFDFITKPWNNTVLMQRIETALQLTTDSAAPYGSSDYDVKGSDGANKRTVGNKKLLRTGIIGKSRALQNVLATVERIAPTNASVLITGESGTGKELIARAIHENSRRAERPFVEVNLGGISQSLFESEMFGHKKGAFTDAIADRAGRFQTADTGTIFLDEIGELDLSCQVKLLRVLQEQTFEPLGDSKPHRVDVRVVSATNADLKKMVKEGTFREDLYYRINLITIEMPALRDRREDIPLLVKYFIDKQCEENKFAAVQADKSAMDYLSSLPYPGNIRELKNLVERTLLVRGGSMRSQGSAAGDVRVLTAEDFRSQYEPAASVAGASAGAGRGSHNLTLDEMEKATVIEALKKFDGNMARAAKSLGISRAALYRRLEKYGISNEKDK
jgi:two-component system NtrC family response regulator